MATTKIHSIKTTLIKSVEYISNPGKTREGSLVVSSFGNTEPAEVVRFFDDIRQLGTGRSKSLAQHIIQSFVPGEITPEDAHILGMELCKKLLNDEYHYILATHIDHKHIHNHIIVCDTNFITGKSFGTEFNKGGKKQRAWAKVRAISDEICKEHNLSVIEEKEDKTKGISHFEWEQNQENMSWKSRLRLEIDRAVLEADDFKDFLRKCWECGIDYEYRPDRVISLKFKFKDQVRYTRAKTLGWYYEPDRIEKRINLKNGLIGYKICSDIIDVQQKVFQNNKYLLRWADIENMKETAKAINYLTSMGLKDTEKFSTAIMAKVNERTAMIESLNEGKAFIDDLKLKIQNINTYNKYKSLSDELERLNFVKKKKFEKEHADELSAYRKASGVLTELYPKSTTLPDVSELEKKLEIVTKDFDKLKGLYRKIDNEINEFEKARQTIIDFHKTNNTAYYQEQQKRKAEKSQKSAPKKKSVNDTSVKEKSQQQQREVPQQKSEKQQQPAYFSRAKLQKEAARVHNQPHKKKIHSKSQELE